MKDLTVFGKSLILAIIGINLTACANQNFYGSYSSQLPAVQSYKPGAGLYGVVYNLAQYNFYSLNAEEKEKQQEAVFFALNNLDNGQLVEWYHTDRDSYGQVRPVQSYPSGGGYCRTIHSLISVNNNERSFTETACKGSGHKGWRFIRK